MKKARLWAMVLAVTLLMVFPLSCVGSDVSRLDKETPRLDKDTLKGWLSDPQVIILDVRAPKDWDGSDRKIQGAVRRDPNEVKTWAASLPKDKKIVLYCT